MNKTELAKRIAEQTPLSQREAGKVIDAFVDVVKAELQKDGKVQLIGFGTWEVKTRAARTGVNPQTRQPIPIPESKVPKFTPGKALKDSVNS
jgi:DNA-binding protein HU-beta